MTGAKSKISIIAALMMMMFVAAPGSAADAPPAQNPNDWLLNAPNDTERFRLLQGQLRGTDQPMWEVGERYRGLHEALSRQNYDLALYHWDKIKTTVENAIQKRPARRASAETLFLKSVWGEVREGLATKDKAKAWAAFEKGTEACRACHRAEKMEFMNDQPVFDLKPASR